jgi:hypothetical protein
LWFIISNHMDLGKEGMSRKMSRRYVGASGKYRNDRRLKLLLPFILMDRMGRISGVDNPKFKDEESFIQGLEIGAEKIKKQYEKQSRPVSQNPAQFVQIVGANMRKHGWSQEVLSQQLKNALRKKSDKDKLGLSDEQIDYYVRQYLM